MSVSPTLTGVEVVRRTRDFDPAALNDALIGCARKYMPNVEGMTWKEMVAMGKQTLEGQDITVPGAVRKMFRSFEVVHEKMGTDNLPTVPRLTSGRPAVVPLASTWRDRLPKAGSILPVKAPQGASRNSESRKETPTPGALD